MREGSGGRGEGGYHLPCLPLRVDVVFVWDDGVCGMGLPD